MGSGISQQPAAMAMMVINITVCKNAAFFIRNAFKFNRQIPATKS